MAWTLVTEGGGTICSFTSFISSNIKDESKVCSEAVEEGSFASYNKVDSPLEIKVTLGISGADYVLQGALQSLERYSHSTELVSLITPSAEYSSLNLRKYDYRLDRRTGYGALYVTLDLVEVRQVRSEYSNVQIAPKQARGTVQAKQAGTPQANSPQAQQSAGGAARGSLLNGFLGGG